jgi:hypothetical protein
MQAYNSVPEAQRDRLAALTGERNRFIGGSADTMYIPGRHRDTFMSTLALFLQTNCFFEIAAPTALHLALPPDEDILFVDHVCTVHLPLGFVDTTDAGLFSPPLSGGYGSHLSTPTLCEGSGLKAEKWIRSTRSIGVSQVGKEDDGSRDQSGLGTCGNYFTSRRRGKVSHSPIEHSAAAFSMSSLVNSYSESPDKFHEPCVHWANFCVLSATQASRKNAQNDWIGCR